MNSVPEFITPLNVKLKFVPSIVDNQQYLAVVPDLTEPTIDVIFDNPRDDAVPERVLFVPPFVKVNPDGGVVNEIAFPTAIGKVSAPVFLSTTTDDLKESICFC
jgi:hypothetical protein